MTKSVGCHKRAKPGGEREEKGGREEGGEAETRGCKGRQSDPSGPDKAEWKTDECGEQGGEGMERGSTREDILSGVPCQPPPTRQAFSFSPERSCSISAFPSRLKQQFVARGKNERE